jgi:hypothetical protein
MLRRATLLAATTIAACLAPLDVRAEETPTPDAAFADVRAAMAARTTPRYGLYTVRITFERDGRIWSQKYDELEYFYDGVVHGNAFSREEEASPFIPPGGFSVAIPFVKFPRKEKFRNPLGAPILAIDYDFGLLPRVRRTARPEPSATNAPGDGTRVIGRVQATARDYDVTRVGIATDDGRTIDHLTLVPTHDPKNLRLRELWIDTATHLPTRLRVAGNFTRPPSTEVTWTVFFRTVDGTLLIDREIADAPLAFGFDGDLRNTTYAFTDVTLENKLKWLDTLGRNGELAKPDIVEP